tara:strand:- start:5 stop:436 length:432 start_codon:yes stop_codon:yes gene_type:complete
MKLFIQFAVFFSLISFSIQFGHPVSSTSQSSQTSDANTQINLEAELTSTSHQDLSTTTQDNSTTGISNSQHTLTTKTATTTTKTFTSSTSQFKKEFPGVNVEITVPKFKIDNTLTILSLCTVIFFVFFLFIVWLRNKNLKTTK